MRVLVRIHEQGVVGSTHRLLTLGQRERQPLPPKHLASLNFA